MTYELDESCADKLSIVTELFIAAVVSRWLCIPAL